MSRIEGIRFAPDRTWTLGACSSDQMSWRNPEGDEITLLRVLSPAELPSLDNVAAVREHCRRFAARENGALVSADVVDVAASRGVQVIYKMERHPAHAYTGLLIVPAADPYDPHYPGKVLCSRADDEHYDAVVPDHPLSKLRRWLPELRRSVTLSAS